MSDSTALESVLKKERTVVLISLAAIVAISWLYLVRLAGNMSSMPAMNLMAIRHWGVGDFVLTFIMWSVMMVGMMLPSATPAILDFAKLSRARQEGGETYVPTAVFMLGYLTVWIGCSLGATLLQWGLNALALLSPAMVVTSPVLGGLILLGAGAFQWTPIHKNFLAKCRNPLESLRRGFGEGGTAWVMGIENGANCLGCCMILMLLLFVGGVMNLLWVALIAAFVLVEKVVPYGQVAGRYTAMPLALAGVSVIAYAVMSRPGIV